METGCRWAMALVLKKARESRLEASYDGKGIRVGCDLSFGPPACAVGLGGSLELRRDAVKATLSAELGILLKGGTLRITAGLEDLPLDSAWEDWSRALRFGLGWDSKTRR